VGYPELCALQVKRMAGPATDTSVGGPVADEFPSALPDDDEDMGAAMPQDGVALSEAQLLQVWCPLGLLCLSGNQKKLCLGIVVHELTICM
jgi:hypothetical protein